MQLWCNLPSICGLWCKRNKNRRVFISSNLHKQGEWRQVNTSSYINSISKQSTHYALKKCIIHLQWCKWCSVCFKCLATLLIHRKKLHISFDQLWSLHYPPKKKCRLRWEVNAKLLMLIKESTNSTLPFSSKLQNFYK